MFEQAVAQGLGSWPEGTVFLAAVSGGADSSAMLAALVSLRESAGFQLYCLHIEHGIRSMDESEGDALAVKALCERLAVPCCVVSIKPGHIVAAAKHWGNGIEAAARHFRTQAWQREARRIEAARVLVAHTQDDLLETALMRILRGVGPAGLAAMPREKGLVLRPLLELTRRDVLAYLEERGLPYQSDSSNGDIRYLRNRIRHKLIPCLDAFFPQWRSAVPHLSETQGLVAELLANEARGVNWERLNDERLRTAAPAFFALPLLLREEALFQAIDTLTENKPGVGQPVKRANLRRFSEGSLRAMDAGLIRLEKRADGIDISLSSYNRKKYDEGFALVIREPGRYTLSGFGSCTLNLTIEAWSNAFEVCGSRCAAVLPLVFRRVKNAHGKGYVISILVEDINGPIARITVDKSRIAFLATGGSASVVSNTYH
ncbi:MAG: tRNA lysidine(34) synthetase TilS [Treponema sp.]|jgi:tRNA(Ile)-lysidine synthase|nr:tRNA lysidine(34) synthetase TilS [Treponema sp.]